MAFDIKNPFKGLPKWGVYTAIGGGAIIGGYALYRHHESTGSWSPFSSAASSTTSSANTTAGTTATTGTTVTDPTTGTVYQDTAIDPETGLTYASEISQYGSVASAEASVTDYGTGGASQTYDSDYVSQEATDQTTTTSGTNVYTSNSAWAQAVQAGLEDVAGGTTYDGTDIGTAIGDYLTGTPVTSAQAAVINIAIAEYGPPPIGNLQVILQPTTTSSTTTTSTALKPAFGKPASLKIAHTSSTGYTATWTPVQSGGIYASSYTLAVYPSKGGNAVIYDTVNAPDSTGSVIKTFTESTKGTYSVHVWANETAGVTNTAPPHATATLVVD